MSDYEQCSIKRKYTIGTRMCPYCRDREEEISAYIEYDATKNKSEVLILWMSYHLKHCRNERMAKAHNYIDRVQGLKICMTCTSFNPATCPWEGEMDDSDCDKYGERYDMLTVEPLGYCDQWEKSE